MASLELLEANLESPDSTIEPLHDITLSPDNLRENGSTVDAPSMGNDGSDHFQISSNAASIDSIMTRTEPVSSDGPGVSSEPNAGVAAPAGTASEEESNSSNLTPLFTETKKINQLYISSTNRPIDTTLCARIDQGFKFNGNHWVVNIRNKYILAACFKLDGSGEEILKENTFYILVDGEPVKVAWFSLVVLCNGFRLKNKSQILPNSTSSIAVPGELPSPEKVLKFSRKQPERSSWAIGQDEFYSNLLFGPQVPENSVCSTYLTNTVPEKVAIRKNFKFDSNTARKHKIDKTKPCKFTIQLMANIDEQNEIVLAYIESPPFEATIQAENSETPTEQPNNEPQALANDGNSNAQPAQEEVRDETQVSEIGGDDDGYDDEGEGLSQNNLPASSFIEETVEPTNTDTSPLEQEDSMPDMEEYAEERSASDQYGFCDSSIDWDNDIDIDAPWPYNGTLRPSNGASLDYVSLLKSLSFKKMLEKSNASQSRNGPLELETQEPESLNCDGHVESIQNNSNQKSSPQNDPSHAADLSPTANDRPKSKPSNQFKIFEDNPSRSNSLHRSQFNPRVLREIKVTPVLHGPLSDHASQSRSGPLELETQEPESLNCDGHVELVQNNSNQKSSPQNDPSHAADISSAPPQSPTSKPSEPSETRVLRTFALIRKKCLDVSSRTNRGVSSQIKETPALHSHPIDNRAYSTTTNAQLYSRGSQKKRRLEPDTEEEDIHPPHFEYDSGTSYCLSPETYSRVPRGVYLNRDSSVERASDEIIKKEFSKSDPSYVSSSSNTHRDRPFLNRRGNPLPDHKLEQREGSPALHSHPNDNHAYSTTTNAQLYSRSSQMKRRLEPDTEGEEEYSSDVLKLHRGLCRDLDGIDKAFGYTDQERRKNRQEFLSWDRDFSVEPASDEIIKKEFPKSDPSYVSSSSDTHRHHPFPNRRSNPLPKKRYLTLSEKYDPQKLEQRRQRPELHSHPYDSHAYSTTTNDQLYSRGSQKKRRLELNTGEEDIHPPHFEYDSGTRKSYCLSPETYSRVPRGVYLNRNSSVEPASDEIVKKEKSDPSYVSSSSNTHRDCPFPNRRGNPLPKKRYLTLPEKNDLQSLEQRRERPELYSHPNDNHAYSTTSTTQYVPPPSSHVAMIYGSSTENAPASQIERGSFEEHVRPHMTSQPKDIDATKKKKTPQYERRQLLDLKNAKREPNTRNEQNRIVAEKTNGKSFKKTNGKVAENTNRIAAEKTNGKRPKETNGKIAEKTRPETSKCCIM